MTKILIAEDEPDIRELITYTLKFGGFDVVVTNNGEEAVKAAPRVRPDLIVLDVRMPRMTGYEACRKLKDNPRTAKIPVIFLSAKGQEKEVLDGMDAGAIDYILKPFDPAALLTKIGEVLSSDTKGRKGKKRVIP
ncbi:MAG: response regulator [Anaerolineae bacterium]|nr:response regulator [Anaerolineae bacterium]